MDQANAATPDLRSAPPPFPSFPPVSETPTTEGGVEGRRGRRCTTTAVARSPTRPPTRGQTKPTTSTKQFGRESRRVQIQPKQSAPVFLRRFSSPLLLRPTLTLTFPLLRASPVDRIQRARERDDKRSSRGTRPAGSLIVLSCFGSFSALPPFQLLDFVCVPCVVVWCVCD